MDEEGLALRAAHALRENAVLHHGKPAPTPSLGRNHSYDGSHGPDHRHAHGSDELHSRHSALSSSSSDGSFLRPRHSYSSSFGSSANEAGSTTSADTSVLAADVGILGESRMETAARQESAAAAAAAAATADAGTGRGRSSSSAAPAFDAILPPRTPSRTPSAGFARRSPALPALPLLSARNSPSPTRALPPITPPLQAEGASPEGSSRVSDDDDGEIDGEDNKEVVFEMEAGTRPASGTALHPRDGKIRAWLYCVFLAIVYNALSVPFLIAMTDRYSARIWTWIVANVLADLVYLADIVVHAYFVGYYNEGFLELERGTVARHYFSGQFRLDVLALLPLDYVLLAASLPDLAIVLRLLRLLRLTRVGPMFSTWEFNSSKPTVFRLGRLLCVLAFAVHLVACSFLWLMRLERHEYLSLDDEFLLFTNFRNFGPITSYTHAVYWAFTLMSGLGVDHSLPSTTAEMAFTLACIVVGLFLLALIVSFISEIVHARTSHQRSFQKKLDAINAYMALRSVRKDLQDRIRAYYEVLWMRGAGIDDLSVLRSLPSHLRTQLTLSLNESIVRAVPFFATCQPGFIRALVPRLVPELFTDGDIIVREGDVGRSMYFVQRGTVAIELPDGSRCAQKGQGEFFGEIALLLPLRRTATVVALTTVSVFRLNKADVDEVLKHYPEQAEMLKAVAYERLARGHAAMSRRRLALSAASAFSAAGQAYRARYGQQPGSGGSGGDSPASPSSPGDSEASAPSPVPMRPGPVRETSVRSFASDMSETSSTSIRDRKANVSSVQSSVTISLPLLKAAQAAKRAAAVSAAAATTGADPSPRLASAALAASLTGSSGPNGLNATAPALAHIASLPTSPTSTSEASRALRSTLTHSSSDVRMVTSGSMESVAAVLTDTSATTVVRALVGMPGGSLVSSASLEEFTSAELVVLMQRCTELQAAAQAVLLEHPAVAGSTDQATPPLGESDQELIVRRHKARRVMSAVFAAQPRR
ncbi:cyclic nucleotide-binding protein [Thecamonas trahens ATCC 50062]|uniref:Cyclic nucleotide-binding protein n=1 Tax=Thecamonas trahens ATCC 50062 TaxID=461836 RepID=A0A0L0D6A8_THETB|nr:cyclic nucleotide-binding protein [Thecamonas trahens ATCC 50062]KNC47922.1 cyclic nucleotide-binding protein [Thecamonas trahens ATCC 50062]|eukprot:XP_013758941.1 cyclic nucleotide-binding protein [Thecamonas trahens ATCC 50062]